MNTENLMKHVGVIPVSMSAGISSYFENALLNTLFKDEDKTNVRDQQVTKSHIFTNKSTRKVEPMAADTLITKALEAEVIRDIKRAEDNIKNNGDKEIAAPLDPRLFHLNSELPQVVQELLLYAHWKLRVPADCEARMKIQYSRRDVRTMFRPPSEEVVCRVVIHFGPDEVYSLTEILTNGKYGESKKSVMTTGSSMLLGKEEFEKCNIFVPNGTRIHFPSFLPPDFEEIAKKQMRKMKGAGRGSSARMDMSQVQSMSKRTELRMKNYRRVSVLIDFGPSEYISNSAFIDYTKSGGVEGIPDKLPTDIPDHMKARLPTKFRGMISDSKGELNRKVKSAGQSVYEDIKHRDELKSNTPQLTTGLIKDINKSVQKNVKYDDIKHLRPEIDEIASDMGLDDDAMEGVAESIKREERRQRQKQRRKDHRKKVRLEREQQLAKENVREQARERTAGEKGKGPAMGVKDGGGVDVANSEVKSEGTGREGTEQVDPIDSIDDSIDVLLNENFEETELSLEF